MMLGDDEISRDYYIIGSKYGGQSNQDVFPQMLKESVIATDFASDIDLTELYANTVSDIVEYLKEKGEKSNSYNALKLFLRLKVGDRIAVKASGSPKGSKGFLSIRGIAEVMEKDGKVYEYQPDGLGHTINVKYLHGPVYKEFELGGYGRTIQRLSKPDHIQQIFGEAYTFDKRPRLAAYEHWLSNSYKQSHGPRLAETSVSNYLKGIKQIEEDLISRNLIEGPSLFAIDEVSSLKDLKTAYFTLSDIAEQDLRRNNRDSNAFQRYIEYMIFEEAKEQEDVFLRALNKYSREELTFYFDFLKKVIEKLNVPLNNQRIIYGTYKDNLPITIGKRYCLELNNSRGNNKWGFITKDKVENNELGVSKAYNGSPQAYFSLTANKSLYQAYFKQIVSACKEELDRTQVSGFSKHHNPFFEKAIFDYAYRKAILDQIFGQKKRPQPCHLSTKSFTALQAPEKRTKLRL